MYSLRRSSVSCGNTTRITTPSEDGFTPRSLSRIERSIAPSAVLSYGEMTTMRASWTWKEAIWLSGVGEP